MYLTVNDIQCYTSLDIINDLLSTYIFQSALQNPKSFNLIKRELYKHTHTHTHLKNPKIKQTEFNINNLKTYSYLF